MSVRPVEDIGYLLCNLVRDSRSALATLARVCRAFEGPAIKALWYSLPGLEPFKVCLPSDVCKEMKDDRGNLVKEFNRELTIEDCVRFERYAPFVEEFTLAYSPSEADCKLFQKIYTLNIDHSKSLLPNLKKLTYSGGDAPFIVPIMRMLMSPHLVEVSMNNGRMLMDDLRLTNSIGSLKKLQSLTIDTISSSGLSFCSKLQSLKKLAISHQFPDVDSDAHDISESWRGFKFRNLKELELTTHNEDISFDNLFKLMKGAPITKLSIRLMGQTAPQPLFHHRTRLMYHAISNNLPHDKLESFELHDLHGGSNCMMIDPILAFRNLTSFSYTLGRDVNNYARHPANFNIVELMDFAERLPKLKTFTCPLDLSNDRWPTGPELALSPVVAQTALTTLKLQAIRCDSYPADIIAFVTHFYSNIQELLYVPQRGEPVNLMALA